MTCWRLSAGRFNVGVVADLLSALTAEQGAPLMVAGADEYESRVSPFSRK
jgi:hypothetical protein